MPADHGVALLKIQGKENLLHLQMETFKFKFIPTAFQFPGGQIGGDRIQNQGSTRMQGIPHRFEDTVSGALGNMDMLDTAIHRQSINPIPTPAPTPISILMSIQ